MGRQAHSAPARGHRAEAGRDSAHGRGEQRRGGQSDGRTSAPSLRSTRTLAKAHERRTRKVTKGVAPPAAAAEPVADPDLPERTQRLLRESERTTLMSHHA